MKLSVIIPVYNERGTVLEIVERVRAVAVDKEIIIVDNCSTDGTRELIQGLEFAEVRVILQAANMQKGNSVKKGIAAARGEFLVIQDADLEYDPQDYLPMLNEAEQDGVLAVLGSRLLWARQQGVRLPTTTFSLGRGVINGLFGLLYGSALTDVASCYKLMPTRLAQGLGLECDGFNLDFEISAKLALLAARRRQRIAEVPVSYAPRSVAEGKKVNWRDGLAAIAALLRYRFWRGTPPEDAAGPEQP